MGLSVGLSVGLGVSLAEDGWGVSPRAVGRAVGGVGRSVGRSVSPLDVGRSVAIVGRVLGRAVTLTLPKMKARPLLSMLLLLPSTRLTAKKLVAIATALPTDAEPEGISGVLIVCLNANDDDDDDDDAP